MSAIASAPSRPAPVTPVADPRPAQPRHASWSRVLRTVPNLIVFSLLGGVLFLGHHTGWKLPKSSALLGETMEHGDDWCPEHLVPESQCIQCKPALYPKSKEFGFCSVHGVAECVLEHPELAQVKGQPKVPRYNTAKALAVLPRPENNSRSVLHKTRLQFASAKDAEKYGIDVDVVQERPMADVLTANGELRFNPTRVTHLSPRAAGSVAAVLKTVGEPVKEGEIVALIDASQVGQAKSQLLEAVVQLQVQRLTVDRLQKATESRAVSQKMLTDAQAELQKNEVALLSARQTLSNLGFDLPESLDKTTSPTLQPMLRHLGVPSDVLTSIPSTKRTANLLPVIAPIEGVVVASDIVAGEVVELSTVMMTVADPRELWLQLSVRQEDAAFIRAGLPVHFQPDDGTPEAKGLISWISPAIDAKTRTLPARVVLENKDGRLRDQTFGTGRIVLRDEPFAVTVPREAVQQTAEGQFVFVRDKNYFEKGPTKVFHVRQVRLGAKDDTHVELLAGVLPGEVVATKGSNVLLGQLLRSNLGAGCGCHEE